MRMLTWARSLSSLMSMAVVTAAPQAVFQHVRVVVTLKMVLFDHYSH